MNQSFEKPRKSVKHNLWKTGNNFLQKVIMNLKLFLQQRIEEFVTKNSLQQIAPKKKKKC